MLVLETTALGLLTFFTVLASGSKCSKETLTRHVVCYYKGEVPLSNFTVCDCTHLIFTNAITKDLNHSLHVNEGIKNDLVFLKDVKNDLITLFTLTLKANESATILKSKNKTQNVVDEILEILEKTRFDGVELDFKFGKSDGVSKNLYTSFVKHLSNSLTSQHKRVKRDEVEDSEESTTPLTETTTFTESTTSVTTTTTDESSSETTTIFSTLSENLITTTIFSGSEEKQIISEKRKDDIPEVVKSSNDSETITNDLDLNDNFKKFLLFIRLPIQVETIGKKYDLKSLTRFADILTVPTHHIFNEKDSHLTYHPSRLMGLSDIFNIDSILDFLTGMGAEKSKIVISMPASVLIFRLKDETQNAPGSPAASGPLLLDQAKLCSMLKQKNWTLERDEDLTAPYAYSQKTWMAFEDEISLKIKVKYILLRELAGGAIYPIDDDINDKSCTNTTGEKLYLTSFLHKNLKSLERKPRALVLQNLQDEIHDTSFSSIEAGVRLSEYRIVRVVDHSGAVHVIRKNTKTQFTCSRQGYFSHPLGCNKFYRCVKFDQYSDEFTVFEYNCPVGLAFDERWEVCVWPGSLPNGAPCTGSSEIAPVPRSHFQCPSQEGYYADPENCRWFFVCLDHARDGITPLTAYEFRCPFGLVFNAEKLACDWPWLVGGCGAHGSQGYIFGVSGGSSFATNSPVFINGGNLEASFGQYGDINQGSYSGNGFGSVLTNADSSFFGNKIQNSYQGSQSAAKGFIASPFDDTGKRGSFATFPDYEISGGRIVKQGTGVVLEENLNFNGGLNGINRGSRLQGTYDGTGVAIDNGLNHVTVTPGYFDSGYGDKTSNTNFGQKNHGTLFVNNDHLAKEINNIITGSTNINENVPFSANIAHHGRTDSSFISDYGKGQFSGQDITTNLGISNTDHAGIGFFSGNVYSKGLTLNNGVHLNNVKTGKNLHTFNNINLPQNGQVFDNEALHFQELLPPFEEPLQPQQVLIGSPVSTQKPFSVNLKSVQINEENNINPTVATSVSSLEPGSGIFQSGSQNSQAGELNNVFGNQYSTTQDIHFTPTTATNVIPVTISGNQGSITSSGVSFGFSGTTPINELNKIVKTNVGHTKSISLNQGSVTSFPTVPQVLSSKAQIKSSTPLPIPSATPGYQEFSSISHGDYSVNVPSAPVVGFTSTDYSANERGRIFGQKSFAPVQTSQTISNVNENSNFGQFKGTSYQQKGVSYNLPFATQSTTQSTTILSGDTLLKNSKESIHENNKFSQEQQNFNIPLVVSVTPIPQHTQAGSSGFHYTNKVGTTIEQKSNKFSFSTPKVELNLPVVTSTTTYQDIKPIGLEGGFSPQPKVISSTDSYGFNQNLKFDNEGNLNQHLLPLNFPTVTSKTEFNENGQKGQTGSIHISQPSPHFSNLPNPNPQFTYTPRVSSSPRPFVFETASQTPRTTITQNNKFTPTIDQSSFVTQVSIEPQEIVSLGTVTEKYKSDSFKSVTPSTSPPKYNQNNFKFTTAQVKSLVNSNSIATLPVPTPTPYTSTFIKSSPGSILSPEEINAQLLNTNVVISSTPPQSDIFIKQPIFVGFGQKNIEHKGLFNHNISPVFPQETPSQIHLQNQPVLPTVTSTVSSLEGKNFFSSTATPGIEIFRSKPAFEDIKTYQESDKYFKGTETFGKQSPQPVFVPNYEYSTPKPFLETEYRTSQVTGVGPLQISSSVTPSEDVKIQSLDSLTTSGIKNELLQNLKTGGLKPAFSAGGASSFESSYSSTIRPVTVQKPTQPTPTTYGNKHNTKAFYGSKEKESKVVYDLPVVSVHQQNYSPAIEIQNGNLQSTPQTILKQQFYSGATENVSPILPTVETSINLVPDRKTSNIFNNGGAYVTSFGKITESPVAFIEHRPNISFVQQQQQHSPKINLLLPLTTEAPSQEYVSPVIDGGFSNQYFPNFKTQKGNAENFEKFNFQKEVGQQNVFYKTQPSGLNSFGHTENYNYNQEIPNDKEVQSIFELSKDVVQIPRQYIIDKNTYSNSHPDFSIKTKSENKFSSYVNGADRTKILSPPTDTLINFDAAGKGYSDNIQEKYLSNFGQVIPDEQGYNNYGKEKQASSTFLYEISTNKPTQRGQGRQYYEVSSSSLPATNKYEEYEIESQRSFNGGKEFSGSSKTTLNSNNQDKNKNVIVLSQVSDANPILVGKLAGQCSCQSNHLEVSSRKRKTNGARRKNSRARQNDLYSTAFVENQGGKIDSESVTLSHLPEVGEITPETVVIGGSKKYTPGLSLDGVKSVTVSPGTNDPFLTSPSSLNPFPYTVGLSSTSNSILVEEKPKNRRKQFRGKARYLPPPISYDYDHSPILASDIALSEYESRTRNEIDLGSSKSFAGAAYDRYGPGGWRGFDETLQGSIDCKRPGLFRHPKYCNKFYACNYDPWKERFTLHVFNCPVRLTYDSSISACNWPVGGPACADDNLLV